MDFTVAINERYPIRKHLASDFVSNITSSNFIRFGNTVSMNYDKNNIKTLRKKFGWSQEELGKKIGVNKSAVQKLENGKMILTTYYIQKAAEAFGCGSEDIWSYGKHKTTQEIDEQLALECADEVEMELQGNLKKLTLRELVKYILEAYNYSINEKMRRGGSSLSIAAAAAAIIVRKSAGINKN